MIAEIDEILPQEATPSRAHLGERDHGLDGSVPPGLQ
jgi:hypothetical protein